MSCIQLSEKHIAAVARGLAFILNGAGGMCRLAASYELPELCDALSACRYPHDFLFDDRNFCTNPDCKRHKEHFSFAPGVRFCDQCGKLTTDGKKIEALI